MVAVGKGTEGETVAEDTSAVDETTDDVTDETSDGGEDTAVESVDDLRAQLEKVQADAAAQTAKMESSAWRRRKLRRLLVVMTPPMTLAMMTPPPWPVVATTRRRRVKAMTGVWLPLGVRLRGSAGVW
jgi:hypothetical protein